VSQSVEKIPLWMTAAPVQRRSRWERIISRVVRPRPARQQVFRFVERAKQVDRIFKIVIAVVTIASMALLLAALPSGRYLAGWVTSRARWTVLHSFGLEPEREEINADWQRRRVFDMQSASAKHRKSFGEYSEAQQRLLTFAGMDPDHVVLRWGNFDKTVMLPSTVYEPDESGRSYRLKPGVRSIWVRNFPMKGDMKAFFQVLDTPEVPELVKGTGASIVEGSVQTTNSWGLRGPEPDPHAVWRGIVLGDSYMQGLFVGDDQTPTECLKRDLVKRLGGSVEILNTGHLGYSPEQYYYALVEYGTRFPPQFVIVSLFANDFAGDMKVVLEGRGGDWEEGKYWLGQIKSFCMARNIPCLFVPAPWVNQLDQPQLAGNYPGPISDILETSGLLFLDPISDFANALLSLEIDGIKHDKPVKGNPLFNGRIGDGHFSPQGCEVWAESVGRRMSLLLLEHVAGHVGRRPTPQ
jgi:hypothetical protein